MLNRSPESLVLSSLSASTLKTRRSWIGPIFKTPSQRPAGSCVFALGVSCAERTAEVSSTMGIANRRMGVFLAMGLTIVGLSALSHQANRTDVQFSGTVQGRLACARRTAA